MSEPNALLMPTRMEAFSDGVFAIAITLLVLEIAVPTGSGDDLLAALLDQWPVYLAYVVSFASIGAAWLAHTAITHCLAGVTTVLLRLNLLLLLVVSFLPFPTKLLGEYVAEAGAERVAVTVYGTVLFLTGVMLSVLLQYAARSGTLRADVPADRVQSLARQLNPGLAGYLVMLLVGWFLPLVAVFGYLVLAVGLIVPFRALRAG